MATQINTPPLAGLSGIARRLVGENLLEENDARKAVEDAARQKIPIGAYLIEHGLASSANVAMALATEFGLPLIDVNALDLSLVPIKLVREDLITKHKALPLFKRGMRLFVGISDPTNLRALDEIKFQSNHIVEPIIVDDSHLERAIEQALTTAGQAITDLGDDAEGLEGLEAAGVDEDGESTGVDANSTDDAPSSNSSTRCSSTRSNAARRTSISSLTKPTIACASAWTACCARSPRRRRS
jgi:type IV pilus assembly protein PilB